MKRQLLALNLLSTTILVSSKLKNTEVDTIRTQTIKDINLHKTGNPDQANGIRVNNSVFPVNPITSRNYYFMLTYKL